MVPRNIHSTYNTNFLERVHPPTPFGFLEKNDSGKRKRKKKTSQGLCLFPRHAVCCITLVYSEATSTTALCRLCEYDHGHVLSHVRTPRTVRPHVEVIFYFDFFLYFM